ncbi:dolichyl-P-Man:Man(7)GlcNAc(2)-PP-dolichol alpha-1,6-mannosyltransferase [Saccharomycopsis crataegensis]|uniref:Mannosyltransferase n=1 Tax=Saccharomycopsis crataegensis TaxID=43959 RepID=A0AAV5QNE8_9ASCO|nr:dolichyl-P-Man:Man(7)GlcNAc(2)-PP-dolichol alpha-1,6-mannosyltransferase [Saccharomycopsis crataegensis]
MAKLDFWDALLVGLISIHLVVSPFTKVEESFNTQAIYDFVNYGLDFSKFDHLEFPGAVYRTFVGSAVYGYITKFFKSYLITSDTPTQFDLQLLSRGLLGLVNGIAMIILRHAVIDTVEKVGNSKEFDISIFEVDSVVKDENTGEVIAEEVEEEVDVVEKTISEPKSAIGLYYALFQYSQFHIIYYSSRFLPNFIALPLTNIALSLVIKANYPLAFMILTFTGIVFRVEVLALAASLFFVSVLVFGRAPFWASVSASFFGVSIGGMVSFCVDSKIWKPTVDVSAFLMNPAIGIIPEISSFIFNVVEKNAEKWGVEPFSAYFTTYMRKLFVPPTVVSMALTGIYNDPTKSLHSITILGLTALLHILIMSFQPHKEWRFIIYDIPCITLVGAAGVAKFSRTSKASLFSKLAVLITLASCALSFVASGFMLYSSSMNYPGGVALQAFNDYIIERYESGSLPPNQNFVVHLDVLPKMTGATLFGELQPEFLASRNISITYDKTEDVSTLLSKWSEFDFLITDIYNRGPSISVADFSERTDNQLVTVSGAEWYQIATIDAFRGITPRPLIVDNGFRPQVAIMNLVKEVIAKKSLLPVKTFIDSGIYKAPAVYIYEKQQLM